MENIAPFLPYIVTLIVAIPGFLAYRSSIAKDRAANTATYQGIADKAAERAVKYEERIDALERRIGTMENSIEELEDWAKRLCEQVISLNGKPVPRHYRRATDNQE